MENEIRVGFPGGKRVDASYKGFSVVTDQPLYQGGGNSAPAPFDFFLISLATCAGFYVLSFLESRGISPEGSEVILKTDYDAGAKKVKKITFDVRTPAGFPEKYKGAVVKAIDVCTVKRHILDPPEFETLVRTGD